MLMCSAALLVGHEARAADATIAVGEVAAPPASTGVDAAGMRRAAEGAIKTINPSLVQRNVVVSLALTRAEIDPVACTVSATVRDARTGVMIAIIEAGAKSGGPLSPALRNEVARAAIVRAIERVPPALRTK
jgi:hypothetical protein